MENGPVKSVIRVESKYNNSRIVQYFSIYSEMNKIDVKFEVDWREQFKMLKLKFPVNIKSYKAVSEIPYGNIERKVTGEEEPCQRWIDISGINPETQTKYGLSIINDSKYSYDINNKEISLTILRSPIYAHHDPYEPEENKNYNYIDQGIQKFNYTIFPHENSWEDAGTIKKAAELNQKPEVIKETYHSGDLPQNNSYLSVNKDNIIVKVLKKAEDNEDLILRCYESAGREIEAEIELPEWGRLIKTKFGPSEIKTFKIPKNQEKSVSEVNLLEFEE